MGDIVKTRLHRGNAIREREAGEQYDPYKITACLS